MNDKLQIRPRSVGEIIDAMFSVYAANFVPLIQIVAVVTVPILLAQGLVNLTFLENLEGVDLDNIESLGDLFPTRTIVSTFVLGVMSWVATTLATGGVVKAVADAHLGRPVDWQDSLSHAWERIGPLLVASLLFAIGVTLGIILFIIPGIVLAIGWSVFAPAVLIERRGGSDSLARAWTLTAGRRWPIFGLFIAIFMLAAIISSVVSTALTGSDYTFADVLIDTAVQTLLAPVTGITAVLLYFDLRARKTGYDNAALAEDVDAALPPPEPPPLIR
jgi:hypothetical protein